MEAIRQVQQWFMQADIYLLVALAALLICLVWIMLQSRHKGRLFTKIAVLEERLADKQEDELHLQARYSELQDNYARLDEKSDELEQRYAALNASYSFVRQQLDEQQAQLYEAQDNERNLREQLSDLGQDNLRLSLQTSQKAQQLDEMKAQFDLSRQQLSAEFESLANRIMQEKVQLFSQDNQQQMGQLMQPLKEQLEGFQRRVNEVHDQSREGQQMLKQHIQHVMDMGIKMSSEAQSLARALKGDKKILGNWGEMQLELALEQAGLLRDQHYYVQASYKDEQGKLYLPDVVLVLPEDKHLIIDSKVSLNAYQEAQSQADPSLVQNYLQQHIKAVRQHIHDLASKDYSRLVGLNSPGFVFMFMPLEAAYIEALKQDPKLFQEAYSKGIVLVSHTTLMPTLRTIAYLWMMSTSNQQALALGDKALDIYNQVARVAEHLSKLGNTLNTASKQYNSTVTSFAGQQGLTSKVERFRELSAKTSKDLQVPMDLELHCQTERLQGLSNDAGESSL